MAGTVQNFETALDVAKTMLSNAHTLGHHPYPRDEVHVAVYVATLCQFLDRNRLEYEVDLQSLVDKARGYIPNLQGQIIAGALGMSWDRSEFDASVKLFRSRRFAKSNADIIEFYADILDGERDNISARHAELYPQLKRIKSATVSGYDGRYNTLSVDWIFACLCHSKGIQPDSRHCWPDEK